MDTQAKDSHDDEIKMPVPVDVRAFMPDLGTSPRGSAAATEDALADVKCARETITNVVGFPGTPTDQPPVRRSVKRRLEFTTTSAEAEPVPAHTQPVTGACETHWDLDVIRAARDERLALNRLVDTTTKMNVETAEILKSIRASSDASLALRNECNAMFVSMSDIYSRVQKQHDETMLAIQAVTTERTELAEYRKTVSAVAWLCIGSAIAALLHGLSVVQMGSSISTLLNGIGGTLG